MGVSNPQPDTLGKPWAPAAHGGGLLGGQAGPGGVVVVICVCVCECKETEGLVI